MSWPTEGLSTNKNLIIIPWTQSVESYIALGANVEYAKPDFCPDCGHPELIFWGKRKRFAADSESCFVLVVRRVRCKGCGKTHTILPAFLLKNQVYLVNLILLTLTLVFIEGKGSRATAEKLRLARSTIRRWINRFKASAAGHYRRLLFLKHNLVPLAPPLPAGGHPKAALELCAQLFALKFSATEKFSRWVSLATCGGLLCRQPKAAS